jgi:hypothetical protein
MLLDQAGLLTAEDLSSIDQVDASGWKPITLTWEGSEFLDAARSSENWAKAKRIMSEKGGGMVLEAMKSLLVEIAKRAAMSALAG